MTILAPIQFKKICLFSLTLLSLPQPTSLASMQSRRGYNRYGYAAGITGIGLLGFSAYGYYAYSHKPKSASGKIFRSIVDLFTGKRHQGSENSSQNTSLLPGNEKTSTETQTNQGSALTSLTTSTYTPPSSSLSPTAEFLDTPTTLSSTQIETVLFDISEPAQLANRSGICSTNRTYAVAGE